MLKKSFQGQQAAYDDDDASGERIHRVIERMLNIVCLFLLLLHMFIIIAILPLLLLLFHMFESRHCFITYLSREYLVPLSET